MTKEKLTVPSGMRDFLPEQVAKRNYIFNTIREVFENYGFKPIETPSMEYLSVLSGKYGEEGEQLMYKVLNSGNFWESVLPLSEESLNSKKLTPLICDKALRYDLTVPLARFVVNHRSEINFPFKRYQIQNVWRGDRPQKGRYREFTQCDADIIGSASMLYEAEFVQIYQTILERLGLGGYEILINNRKILQGMAEKLNCLSHFRGFCTAIDKLDKIGLAGVEEEMRRRNLPVTAIENFSEWANLGGPLAEALPELKEKISGSSVGERGVAELEEALEILSFSEADLNKILLHPLLARGLDYYTGAIFEVRIKEAKVGSVGGGGRYDDLTGIFGLKNMTGCGISLGADRLYDVMEQFSLFPEDALSKTQLLILNLGKEMAPVIYPIASRLRAENISVEIYPESAAKIGKQLGYADKMKISFALIIGSEEMQRQLWQLKNLITGEQVNVQTEELVNFFKKKI
jgi:histidyl-tRNA synthetase